MSRSSARAAIGACLLVSCGWGTGKSFMEEPLTPEPPRSNVPGEGSPPPPLARAPSRTLGKPKTAEDDVAARVAAAGGQSLGPFRNTYYDFPRESDFTGPTVPVMNASCKPIVDVPRPFFETLCVQGSGSLKRGGTVSFAKRDCACAEACPRTGQKICFDALDAERFPWGRGATGKAIAPWRSVAADTTVLPMGAVLYVPELDGVPRDEGKPHDGCFRVEDRGSRVSGKHVDFFTGSPTETARVNGIVPSNEGVTVVVHSPKCAHLAQ